MLWVIFWCPGEDVVLYILLFNYIYLFSSRNHKAVPEVVLPMYSGVIALCNKPLRWEEYIIL
jgi:hypothetical protein